jgi:hypothetical protein
VRYSPVFEGPDNNNLVKGSHPRADSPTSLFSAPSSLEVPLINSLSSPAPTANTSTAANMSSTAKSILQRSDPPTKSPSEFTAGGSGISIKQRLGIGALAPTNPKAGPPPPPKQAIKPPQRSHPPLWAGLKIKKTPSSSISTDVNPSGYEPSLEPVYDSSMHSPPHPTYDVSPNISTSASVSAPNLYRHIPNETMYVFIISSI